MEFLSPISRKGIDFSRLSLSPCGGSTAGTIHYETTPGSRNMFSWKVVHPSHNGNCTLRVGESGATSTSTMTVLHPLDGTGDENGVFACGRQEHAFEGKEFKLPVAFECDSCIVGLEWQTEKGVQHRCTDFISIGREIPECFGACLNGGICQNGVCACPPYFSGSNCQTEDPNRDSGVPQESILS